MDVSTVQYCSTCRTLAGYYCNGCNRIFCQHHADEHRQSLYEQLDWLSVDHDDLVHTLDNTSSVTQKYQPLKKIIDKWEEESIKSIQKTANEARNALIDAIKTHINGIKEKLKLLTEKLNQILQINHDTFDERNIKQWTTDLHNLKNEYITTSTFTVRIHGNKPVVMPIIKIQPDPIPEKEQQNSYGLVPIQHSFNATESSCSNIKQEETSRTSLSTQRNDRFYTSSEHIKIFDNGQLLFHDSRNGDASIRGFEEYSHGEHKLFFRIEHMISDQWIFFGIISKSASFNSKAYLDSSAYGWTGYNNVYINGKSMSILNGYLNEMKINDFIELTIDCNKQSIYLWHSRQTYKNKLPVDIKMCAFPWQFLISCHNARDAVRIFPSSIGSMIKQEQDKLNNDMIIKEIDFKK